MTSKPDQVASELESIFKPLDGRARRPEQGVASPVPPRRRRGLSRWHLGVGAALVAVPLVAATLALNDGRAYSEATVSAPPPAVRPAQAPSVAPTQPLAVAPPVEAAPPVAQNPERDEPVATASPPPAARPVPRERPRRQAVRRADQARCAPGVSDRYCLFEDVLEADARLRLAYDRADRAGVPAETLAAVNRSWRRARRGADADPLGTIRRYDRLADALDDERYGADQ